MDRKGHSFLLGMVLTVFTLIDVCFAFHWSTTVLTFASIIPWKTISASSVIHYFFIFQLKELKVLFTMSEWQK